jgi:hypothetical protein
MWSKISNALKRLGFRSHNFLTQLLPICSLRMPRTRNKSVPLSIRSSSTSSNSDEFFLRSDQDERLPPPGPARSQRNPEQLVHGSPSTARSLGVQGQQLLMKGQVFKDEVLPGTESADNQPRKRRSDAIIAEIISEKSESSFAPSHSFCRCTMFWRGTGPRCRRSHRSLLLGGCVRSKSVQGDHTEQV